MAKKDKTNNNEKINIVDTECKKEQEAPKESAEDIITAEDLIKLAEEKVLEYKTMAQRIQAEFDNYRKRTNESVKNARIDGGSEVVLGILPIIDTIEIALKMVVEQSSLDGINLIYKQILSLLAKYDTTEIDALGKDFDPEYHNAIMQVDDPEMCGKVIEVVQKGYVRQGKVIRYAMVKVAK